MKRLLLLPLVLLTLAACDTSGTASPLTSPNTSSPAVSGATVSPVAPASATFTVKGKGSRSPHITLQAITYVVSWNAKGGQCFGSAGCLGSNFIVDVVGGGGSDDNVINDTTPDNISKSTTGETPYTVTDSGVYLLKVDASSVTWTVTFTPA